MPLLRSLLYIDSMWWCKPSLILETIWKVSRKNKRSVKYSCALKMNWIKLVCEVSFLKLQTLGVLGVLARKDQSASPLLSLGPGQHFFHVCNNVRDNSPHSSSNVHLLWIHSSHSISVGVMEEEIFIDVII